MSELVDKLLNRLTDPMNFGARLCDVASMEELLTLRTDYYALKIELQVAHNELNHYVESQMVDMHISDRDMAALRRHEHILWERLQSRPHTRYESFCRFNVDKEFFRIISDKLLKLEMAGLV
ncbi:hypothetical protein [Stenotrophomonas phage IME-SM1]|uniref:Uncharacterized protein n=1 Tax=Stenotrophomonas phage IME-SM1 TaxID=1654717 RepID=A0A0H4ISD0_9CAUD|nr:hypothetical protein KMC40_gp132 [Stenotrophomonas phage IME-SM1]AKO61626.1 hypothetical protein [Stenotrophomonas phage IME-SM1]